MKKILLLLAFCPTILFGQASTDAVAPSDSTEATAKTMTPFTKGWAVGVDVFSTYGLGLKVSKQIIDNKLSVTLVGNYASFKDIDISKFVDPKLTSKASITLGKVSLAADYYILPYLSVFAGANINLFEVDLNMVYKDTVLIVDNAPLNQIGSNDTYYTPAEMGIINGKIKPATIAPFIGVGFGKAVPTKRVGAKFDLGVAYNGAPSIKLTGSEYLGQVANQINPKLESSSSSFQFYPYMNFSINVKLNK